MKPILFLLLSALLHNNVTGAQISGKIENPGQIGIAGVKVYQKGIPASAVISGVDGSFSLKNVHTLFQPRQAPDNRMTAPIPLRAGQKARIRIFTVSGEKVFDGLLSHGREVNVELNTMGVFLLQISSPDFSRRWHFASLGKPIRFHALSNTGNTSTLAKMSAIQASVPIVFEKPGYATKTFMLEPGLNHRIGFGAPIARAFDPENYPKYPGMNLELAEDWNTADWPNGLDWNDKFQSNDIVWEPSDGGFNENLVRFQPEGIKFKDDMMVLQITEDTILPSPSKSEGDNIGEGKMSYINKTRYFRGGEIRSKKNHYRFGRYEVKMKPPARGTNTGSATGFVATMFTFFTPRGVSWRENDIEVEGNKPNSLLTNIFYTNNQSNWSSKAAAPIDEVEDYKGAIPAGFDSRDWHVYAFEWMPEYIKWYVDGALIRTYNHLDKPGVEVGWLSCKIIFNFWLFDQKFGTVGGDPSGNVYPIENKYDYFRFYRWDKDGNKTTYPETKCRDTSGNNCP